MINIRFKHSQQQGFTLLEILVAVAIFGIIGVLATGGLSAIIDQSVIATDGMKRLNQMQRSMRLLTQDLYQLHPRVVRDELGRGEEDAVISNDQDVFIIRFSREGWRNPAGLPRANIQRVQYRIEENTLIREHWPVLDRPLGLEPVKAEILDGVTELTIEFLDYDNEWQELWPPFTGDNSNDVWPRAVRVRLTLEGMGEITRLIEVAG